jgi:hypothetical protein
MNRALPAALLLMALGLGACSDRSSDPGKLSAKEKEIVAAARRAVEQYEDWADQAEYKIQRDGSGWQVTARKVVHPEAKGTCATCRGAAAPFGSTSVARWPNTGAASERP